MTPKRILIPAYDFKPMLGGVANYGHELAVQFSKRARVHVVARKLPGMEESDRHAPYAVSRTAAPASGLLSIPLFARRIRRILRVEPPDVIFCPTWFPDGVACRWALDEMPIPYFVAAHGTELFEDFRTLRNSVRTRLLRGQKWQVLRGASKVFPVSEYTRRAVLEAVPGRTEGVVTVHNGVNRDLFHRSPVPPEVRARYKPGDERILLTVTRLFPYKGVDRVLESLPVILRAVPEVKYLVVGVGPDLPRLQDLTVKLGLESRVSFLGRLPLRAIVDLYNSADLFVLLSREEPPDVEGFGLVFLEAAACGLPSVGGRSGGIPDAVDDGRSGWLVDPSDTGAIASTIIHLFRSPETLRRASEHCLAVAREASWERAGQTILGEMFGDEGDESAGG